MKKYDLTNAAVHMLKEAHAAHNSGFDVVLHVSGVGALQVSGIDEVRSDPCFATVRGWLDAGSKTKTWLVPLAGIKAVQISDVWPA